jgi:hypothetical protein
MAGDTRPHHQFVVSNDAGVVIRCCIHCGLSHQMESYQDPQTRRPGWVWNLILDSMDNNLRADALKKGCLCVFSRRIDLYEEGGTESGLFSVF